ncbi:glutamate-ammonia ligase adenylyltransferase, partial [Rhizobium sp. PDO1-076]
DRLRIFAAEQRFLIGIRLLTGSIAGSQAGRAFTDLAGLVIDEALRAVIAEMELAHGRLQGGRVTLAGMGKLGSYELTAGSDVDLILLYEHDDDAHESDGPKPLDPVRYYTRLTQRMIAALSAPTAEGVLYEVDMRLRPSGNKGPVATRLRAFAKYQREEAWTWEHMALSRMRLLCGDASLIAEAEAIVAEIMALNRDEAKTAKDVAEMRALIDKEKPPRDIWDLKLIAGGLIDIEFIAQHLALVAAVRGTPVRTNGLSTAEALKALASLMDPNDLDICQQALKLYTDVSQVIRLCIEGPFEPAKVPAGLTDLVARAGESPDLKLLEAEIKRLSKAVRKVFSRVVQRS